MASEAGSVPGEPVQQSEAKPWDVYEDVREAIGEDETDDTSGENPAGESAQQPAGNPYAQGLLDSAAEPKPLKDSIRDRDREVSQGRSKTAPAPSPVVVKSPARPFGAGLVPREATVVGAPPSAERSPPGPRRLGREPERKFRGGESSRAFGANLLPEETLKQPAPSPIEGTLPGPRRLGRKTERPAAPRAAFGASLHEGRPAAAPAASAPAALPDDAGNREQKPAKTPAAVLEDAPSDDKPAAQRKRQQRKPAAPATPVPNEAERADPDWGAAIRQRICDHAVSRGHVGLPIEELMRLERTLHGLLALAQPDGSLPLLGAQELDRLLASPAPCEWALAKNGPFTMRSSWNADADYLLFNTARNRNAGASAHRDLLQIIVSVNGAGVLVDPSARPGREGGPWQQTRRHNTVCVDGVDQPADEASDVRFEAGPRHVFVRAAIAAAPGVRHVRKILYVDRRWWLLLDALHGPQAHRFEQTWQFEPEKVITDPARKSLVGGGLLLTTLAPDETRLELDDGEILRANGQRERRPVARYVVKGQTDVIFATVLFPLRQLDPADVVVTRETADDGTIALAVSYDGITDGVAIAQGLEATSLRWGAQTARGEAALWRITTAGQVEQSGVVG